MSFPRTEVGGLSVSRMIAGTNWFLGYSHATRAKDQFICDYARNAKHIADVLEVFFRAGIDTVLGNIENDFLYDGIREAEDRTGVKCIFISIPGFVTHAETPGRGFLPEEVEPMLNLTAERGAAICMPHQMTTDALLDRCTREIRHMDQLSRLIRERNMIPGLSTHMPEAIVYADETGLDVDTYISIFNSAGFLMQLEVDWTQQIIYNAKKPVITIKPMAAGHLRPLQALTFAWNAIRPIDMITVGTMTPDEAKELIDLSLEILERQYTFAELQQTRSKASVLPKS